MTATATAQDLAKIGAVVREGRKVIKSATLKRAYVMHLLADAFAYDISKALLAMATLKRGEKFKFKHKGYNVTLEPLADQIHLY